MSSIVNGRRINPDAIPDAGVYGQDILNQARPDVGRRLVIERGAAQIETIQPNKRYSKRDLLDKKNNPVKVTDIPDRTKG